MLAVLDVVKNVFAYDLSHLKLRLPTENEVSHLSYSIADICVMTGKERCELLRQANIDPRLFPLFLRAIQHLTSSYSPGSIQDNYLLHRHVSTRVWNGSYACPLLGHPFVVSAPFEDTTSSTEKRDSLAVVSMPTVSADEEKVNGLVNQGATCYLNSLLQSLFHLSAFRSIIYNIPTKEEAYAAAEAMNMEDDTRITISIPYALQRLFCRLQTGNEAADTTELTGSFGWSISDGFVQHDVHELMHVLLNNLEAKLNKQLSSNDEPFGTNAIKELFQGILENYVHVKEEDYYGSTEEPFYDLQLVVKNNKDVYTSLDAFFQVEILDGRNQYCLERDGNRTYHRAEKGVRLKEAPPILLLHLTRFDFSMTTGESKVFTRWAYYNTLNLARYMPHRPYEESQYTLYSVLVHFGSNTGNGHYYCFLRSNGVWYRFNDETVTPATLNEVFGCNFGGYTRNYWGTDVPHMNNAYLLVYIRSSLISLLLRPIGGNDLPEHVVQQLKYEEEEKLRLEKEAKENHLYGRVQFILPKEVLENEPLYYGKVPSTLKIPSQRRGKFRLEADLLSSCKDFIKQKKLCSDKDFPSMILWFPTAVNHTQKNSPALNSSEGSKLLPSLSSGHKISEFLFRVSDRVVEGMKVRDLISAGNSLPLLLTTRSTAPYIDMIAIGEELKDEEPEYHIFHHRLYDPIHLRVIPLESTVIRRYPSTSAVATFRVVEKYMIKHLAKINLDEEDKHLINHDYNFDKMRSEKEMARSFSFQRCDETGVSLNNNCSQSASKHSINKTGSSLLFNVSHSTLSNAESQEEYMGPSGPTDDLSDVMAPISLQPFLEVNHDTSSSDMFTALSVHCERDHQIYTLLYHWGSFWDELTEPLERIPSKHHDPAASVPAKLSQSSDISSFRSRMTGDEIHSITLSSGDILVWQQPVSRGNPNVFYKDIIEFQTFLMNPLSVSIKLNRPPECPTLTKVTLPESMAYEQLQRYVARLIGEKDYDRIRFCRHRPNDDQPFVKRGSRASLPTLRSFFPTARGSVSPCIVYYERCKYPVSQVESSHSLQFQLFTDSVKPISSHWVLFPLNAETRNEVLFQTIVEEIRKDYHRLLRTGNQTQREQWKRKVQLFVSGNYSDALPLSFLEPFLVENSVESNSDSEGPTSSMVDQQVTSIPSEGSQEQKKKGFSQKSKNSGRSNVEGARTHHTAALDCAPKRRSILDFILHQCRPEDAWQHLRLVDCWGGKIYNVYDLNHPLILDSKNSFEESSMYRIEFLPLHLLTEKGDSSPVFPSFSGAMMAGSTGDSSRTLSPSSQRYSSQLLLNVYHFCQVRGKTDSWETHSEPFSMVIGDTELPSDVLSRIAEKLGASMVTLQDWKLALVKERRIVSVEPAIPLMAQWTDFCQSCSPTNGGGPPVAIDVCNLNAREPQKMPFLGLEHAKKSKPGPKQEMVVIRN